MLQKTISMPTGTINTRFGEVTWVAEDENSIVFRGEDLTINRVPYNGFAIARRDGAGLWSGFLRAGLLVRIVWNRL